MTIPFVNRIQDFPSPLKADDEGLLAFGGDLSEEWILSAYEQGIFPWYNPGDPILWWSPNPRLVLLPKDFKVSKSFRNILNRKQFQVSFNQEFDQVIEQCAQVPREGQEGTWITDEMREAYSSLHRLGWAHSVEVWQGEQLVGGLYGIAMGKIFFGESMFSLASNASKIALHSLCKELIPLGVELIDCQVYTSHLTSLGAVQMERENFLEAVSHLAKREPIPLPHGTGTRH